jgi:hypothetical protein
MDAFRPSHFKSVRRSRRVNLVPAIKSQYILLQRGWWTSHLTMTGTPETPIADIHRPSGHEPCIAGPKVIRIIRLHGPAGRLSRQQSPVFRI